MLERGARARVSGGSGRPRPTCCCADREAGSSTQLVCVLARMKRRSTVVYTWSTRVLHVLYTVQTLVVRGAFKTETETDVSSEGGGGL